MIGEVGDSLEQCGSHLEAYVEDTKPAVEDLEIIHDQMQVALGGIIVAKQALDNITRSARFAHTLLTLAGEHATASSNALRAGSVTGSSDTNISTLPEFTSHLAKSSASLAEVVLGYLTLAENLTPTLTENEATLRDAYENTEGQAQNMRVRQQAADRRAKDIHRYLNQRL